MTNPVSRMGLDHPAQSTVGDASLYSRVEAIYSALGNAIQCRWIIIASLANGATVTGQIHGLRLPFPVLKFVAYTAANALDDGTGELTIKEISQLGIVPNGGNPTTQIDVTNNTGGTLTNLRILVKQNLDSIYQRFVDPSLTAGGNVYATLAAAIAAANAGDKIYVKGSETIITLITQSVADLTIEWAPTAKTIIGGSLTAGMNVTGARCRLIAPYLRADSTSCVYALKVAAADCRVINGIVENSAGVTQTAPIQINGGGARAYADIGIIVTGGAVTNDFEDNIGTLRGSFAR